MPNGDTFGFMHLVEYRLLAVSGMDATPTVYTPNQHLPRSMGVHGFVHSRLSHAGGRMKLINAPKPRMGLGHAFISLNKAAF